MRNFTNINGLLFKEMIIDGEFPEYLYLFDEKKRPIGHNSPYHAETLFDHIWWVVDEAYILSRKYKLTEEEQIILMVAAMWHDVGKIFCRSPKTRLLCNNCGRPHSETYIGVCKTDNCASSKFTPKIVMGYSEHEKIGSSKWMFGNISIREKLPSYIAVPSRELIKNHLIVLDAIKHEDEYPFNKLNVLLSLADEKGRDKPDFSVDYSKKFDIIISKYLKER